MTLLLLDSHGPFEPTAEEAAAVPYHPPAYAKVSGLTNLALLVVLRWMLQARSWLFSL